MNGWFDLGKITDVELKPDPVSTGEFKLDGTYAPTITVKNSNLPFKPGDTINATWDDYEEGCVLEEGVLSTTAPEGFKYYVEPGQLKEKKKKKKKKRAIEYNDPMRSISLKDEG